MDISEAEYKKHADDWKRTDPTLSPEELQKRVFAHAAWQRNANKTEEKKLIQWERITIMVLLALLFMLLFFGRAHAAPQFSHINTIQFQHSDNSNAAFYAYPFQIKESTNITFTPGGCPGADCGKILISAAGGAGTGCVPAGAAGRFLIDSGTGACSDFAGFAAATHFFVTGLNSAGAFQSAQPAFGDISGTWAVGQAPASANSCAAHQFTISLASGFNVSCAQPVAADIGSLPGSSGQLLFNNAGAIGAEDPVVSANQPAATTQTITATGALTGVTVTADGTVLVTISGTYAGVAFNFEGSPDGTFTPAFPVTASQVDAVSTLTASGTLGANTTRSWFVKVAGHTKFRLNVTGYTSGTANVTITPVYYQLTDGGNVNVANSPTVTANAGTGQFNVTCTAVNCPTNEAQISGTAVSVNSGTKDAGTQRVVLATDQPALTNKLLVTPDSVALPLHQSVNIDQANGTTLDTNSGTKSAGTIRVVLATDQPALTNKLLVTPDSVALPANQSVNAAQLAGTTTDTNSGTKSAGTLRVVLATDQPQLTNKLLVTPDANVKVNIVGNAGAILDAATGAAPPANALLDAGLGSGATGGFLVGMPVGDTYKNINIATATTTLLITGVAGRQVRITAIHLMAAGADNVELIEGTGATCGTGTAGMAGGTTTGLGYVLVANQGFTFGSGVGTVIQTVTAGDSVCAVTSAAVQLSGGIEHAIY